MTNPTSPSPVSKPERLTLDPTSWVDVWRGWHHDAGATFNELAQSVPWKQARLWRYDHYVVEPRLSAVLGRTAQPTLREAFLLLRATYGVQFDGPALAYYRDGNDALGAHRDSDMRYTSSTMVAILTFGVTRPWLLTSLRQQGRDSRLAGRMRAEHSIDLKPEDGDLFVLGGRAQADWLHAVPPVRGLAEGRISVQWRWTSRTGPPEKGPGYRAPRDYSRSR
jgi:alkylated DNA repair dioxygenase AlkB